MRIDRQDRGGERGGGNGNQRRLVFNPRKEGSEENFPLSSPESSLTRQAPSLLRRCVLFCFVFFFHQRTVEITDAWYEGEVRLFNPFGFFG